MEKLEAGVEKLDVRIATLKIQSEDRESNKEVALGTSKIVSSPKPLPGGLIPGFLLICWFGRITSILA